MKWKGMTSLVGAIVLLVGLIVFEVVLFQRTDDLWVGCRASLLVAMAANFGFGAVLTLFCWAYRFLSDRSPTEQMLLFGVKAGLIVFLFLALISLVLLWCKQPPTYAPCGVVVCTLSAGEIACYALECIGFVYEIIRGIGELLRVFLRWCFSTFQRRNRGKSGSTGHHPPPHP